MKRVRRVVIGPHVVNVEWAPAGFGGEGYLGASQFTALRVWVDNTLPLTHQQVVLLHELLHIVNHLYQLELDERQLRALSLAATELLKRNPALARFMLANAEDNA